MTSTALLRQYKHDGVEDDAEKDVDTVDASDDGDEFGLDAPPACQCEVYMRRAVFYC